MPFRFSFRFALNRIRKGRVASTVLNTVKHCFKNALQKDLLQIFTRISQGTLLLKPEEFLFHSKGFLTIKNPLNLLVACHWISMTNVSKHNWNFSLKNQETQWKSTNFPLPSWNHQIDTISSRSIRWREKSHLSKKGQPFFKCFEVTLIAKSWNTF